MHRVKVRVGAKVRTWPPSCKILYTLALNSIPTLCCNIEKTRKITIKLQYPYLSRAEGVACLHRVARLVFRIFNGFATMKINKLANCEIV